MKTPGITLAVFVGISLAAHAQMAKVNYVDHILPVFRNSCTNCHNPDKKKAGLDLTTYKAALDGGESGAVVKPGNADGSLVYKLAAHVDEPKMPPKGDKLGDADLKLIKDWIAGFALETANSKAAVAVANKVGAAVVSLTRPEGPAPMPGDLPMEPFVKSRALGAVTSLAASPWAPLVAVGGQRQVFLYNVETLEQLGVLAFPEGFPNVLRFSKNAKLLLAGGGVGGKSGAVVLWDVATGGRVGTVGNEPDAVLAADLSADQQFVAVGGPDKLVKIFQTKDGRQTGRIKKHAEWVTAVAYSPDGKFLASADRGGGVEIWEPGPEPKLFHSLAGHKAAVTALAFMPGVLASGSEDGKITLWNVKEGSSAKSWDAHKGGVLWVDFTPDGRLVSCGRDKLSKVWDATGKVTATTEAFGDLATRVAMNGERVVASDWSGEIRVFALADGKAKKIGALSANPPGIAEQLAISEKTLTATTAALPGLQKALADAEAKVKAEIAAEEVKRKADIADAEARRAAAQKQVDDAKAAPGIAEKAAEDASARVAAAKDAAEKAHHAVQDAGKAAGAAKAERETAEQDVKAAGRKLDGLNADLAKRRDASAKLGKDSPEAAKFAEAEQAVKSAIAAAEKDVAAAKTRLDGITDAGAKNVDAAKAALEEARKQVQAAQKEQQAAREELSKVKAGSPKRVEEAGKALAAATADVERLQKPASRTSSPAAKAKAADLSKKLAGLNAEYSKRRDAREKFASGSPEYAKANEAVQAMKPEVAKISAALKEAQSAAEEPGLTAGDEALAKAKAELDAARSRMEAAKSGVARWRRAQIYQTVFDARQDVAALQEKYDDLVATAKDAFRQVEMTKQAIIDAGKTVADGPKTIAEREAEFAAAKKTADEAKAALAAAEQAIEAKKAEKTDTKKIEGELAAAKKELEKVKADVEKARADRNKFAEGTPEKAAAAAKREALRPKQAELENRVAAVQKRMDGNPGSKPIPAELIEAVNQARLALRAATNKADAAAQALANAKAAVADAKKQIPEMKARIPQLQVEGAKTKAAAERAASATAKQLRAAKDEFEKTRARFEASKGEPAESGRTADAAPAKG